MECQLSANDSPGWKKIFPFGVSHVENLSQEGIKKRGEKQLRRKKKKTQMLPSVLILFPLENRYQIAIFGYHFFLFQAKWNFLSCSFGTCPDGKGLSQVSPGEKKAENVVCFAHSQQGNSHQSGQPGHLRARLSEGILFFQIVEPKRKHPLGKIDLWAESITCTPHFEMLLAHTQ